jgi:hypothetical protein
MDVNEKEESNDALELESNETKVNQNSEQEWNPTSIDSPTTNTFQEDNSPDSKKNKDKSTKTGPRNSFSSRELRNLLSDSKYARKWVKYVILIIITINF